MRDEVKNLAKKHGDSAVVVIMAHGKFGEVLGETGHLFVPRLAFLGTPGSRDGLIESCTCRCRGGPPTPGRDPPPPGQNPHPIT